MEIQFRHLPGNAAHAHNGMGNVPGVEKSAQHGESQQHQQNPGSHLHQCPHSQVFHLNSGSDIERIALTLARKGHLGGNGGPIRGGDGHGFLGFRPRPITDHRVSLRCGDGHTFVLIHGLDGQTRPCIHQFSVRTHQHGTGPGGERKLVQQRAAVLRRGVRQPSRQGIHLGGEVAIHHSGIGAWGGPGNQAEGDCPGKEQDAGSNQKNASGQTLREFLSRHDSPPPSQFQCSPDPVCGGDS